MKTKNIYNYKNLGKTLKNSKKTRKNIIYGGMVKKTDNWFIQIVNDCCKEFWLNDPAWEDGSIIFPSGIHTQSRPYNKQFKMHSSIGKLGDTNNKIGMGFILEQSSVPTESGNNLKSLYYFPAKKNPFNLGIYRTQNWNFLHSHNSKKFSIVGHYFSNPHIHFFEAVRNQAQLDANQKQSRKKIGIPIAGWPHGTYNQIRNVICEKDLDDNINSILAWISNNFDENLGMCIICKMLKHFKRVRPICDALGKDQIFKLSPFQDTEDIINRLLIENFSQLKTIVDERSHDEANSEFPIDISNFILTEKEIKDGNKITVLYKDLLKICINLVSIDIENFNTKIQHAVRYIEQKIMGRADITIKRLRGKEENLINKLLQILYPRRGYSISQDDYIYFKQQIVLEEEQKQQQRAAAAESTAAEAKSAEEKAAEAKSAEKDDEEEKAAEAKSAVKATKSRVKAKKSKVKTQESAAVAKSTVAESTAVAEDS